MWEKTLANLPQDKGKSRLQIIEVVLQVDICWKALSQAQELAAVPHTQGHTASCALTSMS